MTTTLKTLAADMTLEQHAAINLMIPVSGCEALDQMIWEAKRDHIATNALPALPAVIAAWQDGRPQEGETWDEMVARLAYEAADAQLAASGWEMPA